MLKTCVASSLDTALELSLLAQIKGQQQKFAEADRIDAYLSELSSYYGSHGRKTEADDVNSWSQIRRSDRIADFEAYLDVFPDGMFANLANQSIEALEKSAETLAVRSTLGPATPTHPLKEDATVGRIFKDCDDCPEMIVIPPGSFRMGSTEEEIAALEPPFRRPRHYYDEAPVHDVEIAYPLAVGRFEVTYAEWDACVEAGGCTYRPRSIAGRGRKPVAFISAENTEEYLAWLNEITGNSYRLLSEAEWEYITRAGTDTTWSCGNDESCLDQIAWYHANSNSRSQEVGTKAANVFGVFDMLGNVSERVSDCRHDSYEGAPNDGRSWGTCAELLRGGYNSSHPRDLRSADRGGRSSSRSGTGFRVARPLN